MAQSKPIDLFDRALAEIVKVEQKHDTDRLTAVSGVLESFKQENQRVHEMYQAHIRDRDNKLRDADLKIKEMQAELAKFSHLNNGHENVIAQLQKEAAQWKLRAEAAESSARQADATSRLAIAQQLDLLSAKMRGVPFSPPASPASPGMPPPSAAVPQSPSSASASASSGGKVRPGFTASPSGTVCVLQVHSSDFVLFSSRLTRRAHQSL